MKPHFETFDILLRGIPSFSLSVSVGGGLDGKK